MDEGIQVDKVIHYCLLHLLPVNVCPKLAQVNHVLHQQHGVQLELSLVSDEGVLHNQQSLLRVVADFVVLLTLGDVGD